ncbi:MAG: hypothetical protein ACXWTS_06785 [Methylococcaceae bacterium]
MFSTLRIFLVIFLATLQLVAPLVHAHASQKVAVIGVHVPGLEGYGVDNDTLMAKAEGHYASAEGIIVGVNAGIKQHLADISVDTDNDYFLLQQAAVFQASISDFDVGFSPPSPPFVLRFYSSSNSPRAPPAQ